MPRRSEGRSCQSEVAITITITIPSTPYWRGGVRSVGQTEHVPIPPWWALVLAVQSPVMAGAKEGADTTILHVDHAHHRLVGREGEEGKGDVARRRVLTRTGGPPCHTFKGWLIGETGSSFRRTSRSSSLRRQRRRW